MKIDCGNKRSISQSSDLPDVSSGIQLWFQPLKIGPVFKQNKDGYLEEFLSVFKTQGVLQTLTPQQLAMKPEGERTWKWRKLHMLPEPKLRVDDIVIIGETSYRVMDKEDNSQYGVTSYDLQEDYVDED
jgi:hypothetical protein